MNVIARRRQYTKEEQPTKRILAKQLTSSTTTTTTIMTMMTTTPTQNCSPPLWTGKHQQHHDGPRKTLLAKKNSNIITNNSDALVIMPQTMSGWILMNASLYVLSGVTQPILMALAQHAGLANPSCQLYMLFYYIGPALAGFTLRCHRNRDNNNDEECGTSKRRSRLSLPTTTTKNSYGATTMTARNNQSEIIMDYDNIHGYDDTDIVLEDCAFVDIEEDERTWPSRSLIIEASAIALFDIFAQSMVYTGNNLAGPTIFAIIYSSVTIWTALYSKIILSRTLTQYQWMGVFLVVIGLSFTALDSFSVGRKVFVGACLIVVGSSFHGLTYVLSEMIMTKKENDTLPSSNPLLVSTSPRKDDHITSQYEQRQYLNRRLSRRHISVRANCAIQGIVASIVLLVWQIVYTMPRLQSLILTPMAVHNTSPLYAVTILCAITFANLLHSITFYVTLKHFPGGATSAGVLKGLQAVLVFGIGSILLCGRWGGLEMCWSTVKLGSLIVVVGGILVYYTATTRRYQSTMSSVRR